VDCRFLAMKRVGLLAAIALLAIATAVRANETSELTAQGYKRVKVLSLASSSRDTPPWSATAYEANVANPVAPRVPARLCFSQNSRSSRYCFLAEAEHHGLKYAFQKVEDLVLRTSGSSHYGLFHPCGRLLGNFSREFFSRSKASIGLCGASVLVAAPCSQLPTMCGVKGKLISRLTDSLSLSIPMIRGRAGSCES